MAFRRAHHESVGCVTQCHGVHTLRHLEFGHLDGLTPHAAPSEPVKADIMTNQACATPTRRTSVPACDRGSQHLTVLSHDPEITVRCVWLYSTHFTGLSWVPSSVWALALKSYLQGRGQHQETIRSSAACGPRQHVYVHPHALRKATAHDVVVILTKRGVQNSSFVRVVMPQRV